MSTKLPGDPLALTTARGILRARADDMHTLADEASATYGSAEGLWGGGASLAATVRATTDAMRLRAVADHVDDIVEAVRIYGNRLYDGQENVRSWSWQRRQAKEELDGLKGDLGTGAVIPERALRSAELSATIIRLDGDIEREVGAVHEAGRTLARALANAGMWMSATKKAHPIVREDLHHAGLWVLGNLTPPSSAGAQYANARMDKKPTDRGPAPGVLGTQPVGARNVVGSILREGARDVLNLPDEMHKAAQGFVYCGGYTGDARRCELTRRFAVLYGAGSVAEVLPDPRAKVGGALAKAAYDAWLHLNKGWDERKGIGGQVRAWVKPDAKGKAEWNGPEKKPIDRFPQPGLDPREGGDGPARRTGRGVRVDELGESPPQPPGAMPQRPGLDRVGTQGLGPSDYGTIDPIDSGRTGHFFQRDDYGTIDPIDTGYRGDFSLRDDAGTIDPIATRPFDGGPADTVDGGGPSVGSGPIRDTGPVPDSAVAR